MDPYLRFDCQIETITRKAAIMDNSNIFFFQRQGYFKAYILLNTAFAALKNLFFFSVREEHFSFRQFFTFLLSLVVPIF